MSQLFWKRVVILQAWCVKLQNYLKDFVSLAPKLILVLAMLSYESMSGNFYLQSLDYHLLSISLIVKHGDGSIMP